MTIAMAVLGLVGVSGIYFRQVRESGLPGPDRLPHVRVLLPGGDRLDLRRGVRPAADRRRRPAVRGRLPRVFPPASPPRATWAPCRCSSRSSAGCTCSAALVFGIAVYRARILQRGAAALLAAGTVLSLSRRGAPARRGQVCGRARRHGDGVAGVVALVRAAHVGSRGPERSAPSSRRDPVSGPMTAPRRSAVDESASRRAGATCSQQGRPATSGPAGGPGWCPSG